MAGGASSTNLDDIFVATGVEARILPELRPSVTSRGFIRWFTGPMNTKTAGFSLLGDPGPSTAFTEGTDYTTVTDPSSSQATVAAAEVGLMTTVSDVLMKISLIEAVGLVSSLLTRSTLEKWETDVAAIADNFANSTTAASTLTPADLMAAISAIEQRDAATGLLVAYLHPKQGGELRQESVLTTSIRLAAESGGVPSSAVSGEGNARGYFGNLFGVDLYQTSLVASSSGLRQGSVFVSGQCIGGYELWGPRIETERRATLRGLYVVSSADYGVGNVEVTNRGQMLKSAA